ncbi:MAG: trypsin-like peptidase domain-containing protein, partial [Pseudomonadota bacterium]
GFVLTNNHVIARADKIVIGLQDGRRLPARLLGGDPETDIALLQIPAKDLVAVPKGNSEELQVGDFVIAIGNPFGLGQTVTSGIVSALERSGLGIEGYEEFIQTDAAINPGNSGGALIDLRGRLVGINTAIVGPTGGNVGIGFAIPINMANEVMEQIHQYGAVQRGQLGVVTQDLDPEKAKAVAGAVVVEVAKGSAAERAGLKKGDVVLSVNGRALSNATQLRNRIGVMRIGQKVNLRILRNGKELSMTAQIAPRQG